MVSCDCLKVALCDQFAHQKTLHAHLKCSMYKRKVWKAGGFCLCSSSSKFKKSPASGSSDLNLQ